jgi:hypothetical protein
MAHATQAQARDGLRPGDLVVLQAFGTRGNGQGRGRVAGVTARLIRAGFLSFTHTGFHTWAIALTDKGREQIAQSTANR